MIGGVAHVTAAGVGKPQLPTKFVAVNLAKLSERLKRSCHDFDKVAVDSRTTAFRCIFLRISRKP